jgi:hypothetical protein
VVLLARTEERETKMLEALRKLGHGSRVGDFSKLLDESVHCLVCRPRQCGRGVNGAQRFDHVLQVPAFASAANRHQWEHRFLRPGQKSKVVRFDTYVVAGSITESLLEQHNYRDLWNESLRQSSERGTSSLQAMERAAIALEHRHVGPENNTDEDSITLL